MRRPLKTDSVRKISALGIPIETVLEIDIATGTPELISVFKDKKHLLVEPVIEWNETINAVYSKLGIDYTIVNVAASNTNGVMNMETSTVLPGLPISHARLTEKANGQNIRSVPIRTIDSLLQEYNMPAPHFLKIDVDGVEILIL